MAAESRARQKSLNGWRNKEGGFNYTFVNRRGTLSTPTILSAITPRMLSWKRRAILQKIQFVIYFLSIINKKARGKVHAGKIQGCNPHPLPRAHSPPFPRHPYHWQYPVLKSNSFLLLTFLLVIGLSGFFTTTPASTVNHLAAFQYSAGRIYNSLQRTSPEIAGNIPGLIPPSYEQLFPPAVVREVDDERPVYFAFAPQDSNLDRLLLKNPLMESQRHPLTGELPTDVLRLETDPMYFFDRYLKGDLFAIDKYENDLSTLPPEKRKKAERLVVASKQRLLKDLGYYSASIDSIDGPMTRAAWKNFERDSHSKNWKTRYNLAMKFFEAGKKTGIIRYYDKTVDHLFWIAQEYSILLPTDTRNEMYDFLFDIGAAYYPNLSKDVRRKLEKDFGALAWYTKEHPFDGKEYIIKTLQACIYLFPNRGPPRWSLKSIGAEDEIPLRKMNKEETKTILDGSDKEREQLYHKLFPGKEPESRKGILKPQSYNNPFPSNNYRSVSMKNPPFRARSRI